MAIALGLGAPVYGEVASRLSSLQNASVVTTPNLTERKSQYNCATDKQGMPYCDALSTQFNSNGTLSTSASAFERHLAYRVKDTNRDRRDLTTARMCVADIGIDPLASDLVGASTNPYVRVQTNGGETPLVVNNLASGVSGSAQNVIGTAPALDDLLTPIATGMDVRDETVVRVLNNALRAVFIDGGQMTHARARTYLLSPGNYKMEIAPHPPQGQVLLHLTDVVFAGSTPMSGTLSVDPTSDLDPTIAATICFARRLDKGLLLTAGALQCFTYPSGFPALLSLAEIENVPENLLFKDGFESGDTTTWSSTTP